MLIINNSHRYISICICNIWYDFDQLKAVIIISVNGSNLLPISVFYELFLDQHLIFCVDSNQLQLVNNYFVGIQNLMNILWYNLHLGFC